MNDTDFLGELAKERIDESLIAYEKSSEHYLVPNMPMIVRIDGKNFKHLTKTLKKPFDETLNSIMQDTLISLCRTIKGAVLGYAISDEIDLLLYTSGDHWYNCNLQGMVASIASLVTGTFNRFYHERVNFTDSNRRVALFDVKIFNIPTEHVSDYFIKKQNYEMRAALEYACMSKGILKGIQKLNTFELKKRLFDEKNIDFDKDYDIVNRLGMVVRANDSNDYVIVKQTPVFEADLAFFNELVDIPFYDVEFWDD